LLTKDKDMYECPQKETGIEETVSYNFALLGCEINLYNLICSNLNP